MLLPVALLHLLIVFEEKAFRDESGRSFLERQITGVVGQEVVIPLVTAITLTSALAVQGLVEEFGKGV